MAIPDPSPYDHFPQFDPSDLDFLPDADFPLDGLASDLDLDDIPIDFSLDDLLLPEDPDPDPNPPSPESANSTVVNNHQGCAIDRSKIEGDDVIPAVPDSHPDPHPPSPESINSTIISNHHQGRARERPKSEGDDVTPTLPNSDADPHPLSPECADSAAVRNQGCTLKRKKIERDDVIAAIPNPPNYAASTFGAGGSRHDEKRKVVRDDVIPANPNPNKLRRSDEANSAASTFSIGSGGCDDVDDRRKARLMRNRESAQLSRQRKKHYVEELEEKVRTMSSVIADLNGKMSFYMSENARLHHQLAAGAGAGAGAAVPAPPPHPQMRFPWIPYPGYPILPNGAHGPAVPIPRLKPQQPAPALKAKAKKSRTKKVAGVTLLGLFLVYLMLGAVLNFGFSGSKDVFVSGKGRVLSVTGRNKGLNRTEEIGHGQNSSVSMPALLYVPRNGKRVEINGNLIIHSVLASERAVAEAKSGGKGKQSSDKEGTSLAIPGNVGSALAIPKSERSCGGHQKTYRNVAEGIRALVSDSQGAVKSTQVDGPLQQWFSEGLAGPILSSGTCTEVFQFEVSPSSTNPSGGIVPATVNATDKLPPGKNRRILYAHPIPLAGSTANDTDRFGKMSENKTAFHANSPVPSMVVSVMADPREAGDGDCDGMVAPKKSISRIFVVVLMDSVKYATYSCMLPLKSYGSHIVN